MTDASIKELFKTLYEHNKYSITIKDHTNYKWNIFIHKNKHIQLDVQTPNALTSQQIDIDKMIEYIDGTSDIKIKYTCMYNDFYNYNKSMMYILNQIQQKYFEKDKNITIKYKTFYD
jgi:hypothetical protein